jgi:aminopeptidase N
MLHFLLIPFLFLSAFGEVAIPRKSDDDLTLIMAQQRKSQIKKVLYTLHFNLKKNAKGFDGRAVLDVDLHRLDLPLSIDFMGKNINKISVNGEEIKKYPVRKGSFDIPQSKLKPKTNIEVEYSADYTSEAGGFYRVKDPVDENEYLYTDFQPYHAHHLFPCFDQPDLKGIYKLTVEGPSDWLVIHNELVEKTEVSGDRAVTTFKETPPLSTYLFFLGAGPYVEWKDKYGDLPLSIYARKSLEKYVDADEIMKVTKKGLKFFNDYFNYPYPFSKYAHVFIPEFAWGGMENPGAITVNEKFLFRGPVPESKKEDRANLILHEMAHMWFGDLVTMEWWNDLWLNESFATFVASLAQDQGLGSKSTWLDFFNTKVWGYWQDQLVTTHPIEVNVPDVRTAKSNFDGITYAKGASALKQLHFFVGAEGFRNGLRNYFKTYAWSNTRRENFIQSIAQASQTDLSDWVAKWLQTAGVNRVSVDFECEKKKLKSLKLIQKASSSETFSPHRTLLALYEKDDEDFDLDEKISQTYDGPESMAKLKKKIDCPAFVFPNYEDFDYALFSLDPISLKEAPNALAKIEDPLTRLMIWNVLHQMVRDAELDAYKSMEMALEGFKSEKDDLLLGNLIGNHSYLRELQYLTYLDKAERAKIAPHLEGILWDRVLSAPKGSSLQMTFFDFYLAIAQTPASQLKLYDLLVKNTPPEGITLDQDRRWVLVRNISRNGHTDAEKIIAQELKGDNTTSGNRNALAARAAIPLKSNKASIWKKLLTSKKLTYSDLKEAGKEIHGVNYPELSSPFLGDYFKTISQKHWDKADDLVDIYFERFYPKNLCTSDTLKMSERAFRKAKHLTSIAKRAWREAEDELKRCIKIRELSSSLTSPKT